MIENGMVMGGGRLMYGPVARDEYDRMQDFLSENHKPIHLRKDYLQSLPTEYLYDIARDYGWRPHITETAAVVPLEIMMEIKRRKEMERHGNASRPAAQ